MLSARRSRSAERRPDPVCVVAAVVAWGSGGDAAGLEVEEAGGQLVEGRAGGPLGGELGERTLSPRRASTQFLNFWAALGVAKVIEHCFF
jgi:hypothetical protein